MGELQQGGVGRVVDHLYEAAFRPELWRTVLHDTSTALGAAGCRLTTYHGNASLGGFWSEGVDEFVHALREEGWAHRNARAARALALARYKPVFTESELFSTAELDQLPFNTEFVSRLGFRWFAGALLARSEDAAVFLIAERQGRQGRFTTGEMARVERLAPHFERAAQVAHRLRVTAGQSMLEAFDLMGSGALLINERGRVLELNRTARDYLGNGIAVTSRELASSDRDANARLGRLIGNAVDPGARHDAPTQGPVALPRRQGRPLIVYAAPIVGAAEDMFRYARAILILVDPDERREPTEAFLREVHGLTRSEAQIAIGLAQGLDLQEIAAERGISVATARVQLKSVFAKTGAHRQSELVARVVQTAFAPADRVSRAVRHAGHARDHDLIGVPSYAQFGDHSGRHFGLAPRASVNPHAREPIQKRR